MSERSRCACHYSERILTTYTQRKHISETVVPSINFQRQPYLCPQVAAQQAVASDLPGLWPVQHAVKCSALLVCNGFIFRLVFITLGMNKGTCALLNLNF